MTELNDMPPEELQRHGHDVFDWIARYFGEIEELPVLSTALPGQVAAKLSGPMPEQGSGFDSIMEEFERTLLPGITHWNHPAFMAYFGITASGPGILGEALAAALNVNAMLWRTSPAATELEEVTLDWLRQMVGLPDAYRGHLQDTASTSTMVALAAAREAAGIDVREQGLAGRDLPRLKVYCSEDAHSSVDKAAVTLGIGLENVRRIPMDRRHRMRPDALAAAVANDRLTGALPIAVVATAGTTSTTAVDPIDEVAEVCERENLWLHVDGAYGGSAAILPELRHLFIGWERADSIVINPHKWLFVPIDCSALFLRNPELLRRAFSVLPEYLVTPEGSSVTNLMEYGPALGRRFRSLKLWMTFCYFGRQGLADRIAEHIRLAQQFAEWVGEEEGWVVAAPVPFSTVCFRCEPPELDPAAVERINSDLLERINSTGEVFLSHTRIGGKFTLRIAIGNIRTEERHVRRAWELLRACAKEVQ